MYVAACKDGENLDPFIVACSDMGLYYVIKIFFKTKIRMTYFCLF